MTPELFRRAEALFHLVVDLAPELREKRLQREDDDVVAAVRSLLAEEDAWGDDSTFGMSAERLFEHRVTAAAGDRIGPYRLRQRIDGEASPEAGQVMRSLAVVHRLSGETGRARELLERALEIAEAHHGTHHQETASVLNNLAVVAYQDGEYGQARASLERSLAILEAELGPDHPDVGTLVNNLGTISRRQGDNRGAAEYLERHLELSRKVLGRRHPDVAMVLRNPAFAERALGELAAARTRLEESLSILEEAMGVDSFPVANAHSSLADLAVREARLDEARQLNARALELLSRPDNPQQRRRRLRVLEAQARVARLRGDLDEASRLCRRAVAEAEALPDPATEATRCRLQLAMVALAEGDAVTADRLYAAATQGLPLDQPTFLDDPTDTASRAAYAA